MKKVLLIILLLTLLASPAHVIAQEGGAHGYFDKLGNRWKGRPGGPPGRPPAGQSGQPPAKGQPQPSGQGGGGGGLMGLGGVDEKMNQGNRPAPTRGKGNRPPSVANRPARSNKGRTVSHGPDAEKWRQRVKRLESRRYADMKPAPSIQAAEAGIRRMRKYADQLRRDVVMTDHRQARRLADRMQKFGEKYHRFSEALSKNPDDISAEQWAKIAEEVRTAKVPEEEFVPQPRPKPKPKPQEEDLGMDFYDDPDAAEALEEQPPKEAPKPKEIVKPEDRFRNLAEAIREGRKPKNMSTEDWLSLMDEYYKDATDLQADAASTSRKLNKLRERELADVEEAIRDAEAYAEKARELEKTLDDDQMQLVRRSLAWRHHQAKLAIARAKQNDAQRMEQERQGQDSGRVPVGGYAGAVAKTFIVMGQKLSDAFREMDISGHGPAPTSNKLYNTEDGLPLPEWMGKKIAGNEHGLRSQAKINSCQQWLAQTRMEIATTVDYIKNQDRDEFRVLRTVLEKIDREDGAFDDPDRVKYRRQRLRALINELNATRAERVAKRRAELEKDAAQYRNMLEQELKRYEAMKAGTLWENEDEIPRSDDNTD